MVLTFLPLVKPEPRITLQRLFLRPPVRRDWADWASLRDDSRDFLVPWEPAWAPDALSRGAFRRQLAFHAENMSRDLGYSFLIFRRVDEVLVGGITIANVRRGVSQCCSIGYWIGHRHARQGYMTEAVHGICSFAFGQLNLNRIEAACLVSNLASQGVLLKAGFRYEGIARQFLKINGQWQDHKVFSILQHEYMPGVTA